MNEWCSMWTKSNNGKFHRFFVYISPLSLCIPLFLNVLTRVVSLFSCTSVCHTCYIHCKIHEAGIQSFGLCIVAPIDFVARTIAISNLCMFACVRVQKKRALLMTNRRIELQTFFLFHRYFIALPFFLIDYSLSGEVYIDKKANWKQSELIQDFYINTKVYAQSKFFLEMWRTKSSAPFSIANIQISTFFTILFFNKDIIW